MKKKIVSIIFVFAIVFTLASPVNASDNFTPKKISDIFKDKTLAKIFAEENGWTLDHEVTFEEMMNVTSIEAYGDPYSTNTLEDSIKTLEGINYFTEVSSITIHESAITSLDPIANMKKIKVLVIGRCPLKDINALSTLPQLVAIQFYSVDISDISPLKNSTNLLSVSFHDSEVYDLTPLKHLSTNQKAYIKSISIKSTIKVNTPSGSKLTIPNPFKDIFDQPVKPTKLGAGGRYDSATNTLIWDNINDPTNSYFITVNTIFDEENRADFFLSGTVKFELIKPNNPPVNEKVYSTKKIDNTTYYYSKIGKEYFNYKTIYQKNRNKVISVNEFNRNKCKQTQTPNSCAAVIKKYTYYNNVIRKSQYYVNNNLGHVSNYKEVIKNNKKLTTNIRVYNRFNNKLVRISDKRYLYARNNKLKTSVNYRYSKGKIIERREYQYNTQSQLKSNKYGKAYYYRTTYRNGKAVKTIRAVYTKNSAKINYVTVETRR